ncbi:aminotransferase class I/II-fold pyridoxal phosphate-dependent enzyme [Puniceicoccales bacterium CK1056]|uniref:Aminotransferase class I/II-fold pyridoxal phosphate-dependent enzyme n=1 Tax=Oceanipulchritudo coccoides TaxID=2706888 RepID=A0A6B2M3G0_9BACT|nr:aminotransferase class I/II-fold pyridoxal phosphate-dependent enzyme [Oceanipulchritudo coccoides]NDV63488.1 aminotransferase class I/II-fold pyridoxal phosphate-dependent enzyme [Oceanipulchritudo coccoides]
MNFYFTWFIVAVALGALGVWLARGYARKFKLFDQPNERSFHNVPTPRIGGIGLLLPVLVVTLLLVGIRNMGYSVYWLGMLLPAVLVALLSFFDDCFDLSRLIRFAGHGVCAILLMLLLRNAWVGAPLPLLGTLLPVPIVALLLFIWITGLTNSYNFMDGIDGISAIQGIVALGGWLSIWFFDPAVSQASGVQQLVMLGILGGLVGFLVLNWAPASIFMGDVGSTFLGFYFAAIPFGATAVGLPFDRALEASVFFVWPFIADASMTFGRRVIHRESIFNAHRSHVYQILAGTFGTRDAGHQFTSVFYGLLALVGVGLYWTGGPLWAKLCVLLWVWLAVVAWTYGLRKNSQLGRSVSTVKGAGDDNSLSQSSSAVSIMPFDIFLSPPELTEAERLNVIKALDSNFIAPVGPQVNEFEEKLASYLQLSELHALNSGTAAIHLGLRALGVGPGDCVICPDLTFIASVNPVRYLGAEPVLVDVSEDNWAIDPDSAREAIRTLKAEGRTVRAMVVVHAFGLPAPMKELMEIADEEGVPVLEDCAGAFGSRIGDQSVGSFGAAAAFSFNGNKVLTTSGGGALYIKDPQRRQAARSWANQGKVAGQIGYEHNTLGYNYKLSNISAAIGLGQLETLDQRLARKAGLFQKYKEAFSGMPEVTMMPEPDYGRNNYWLSCLGVNSSGHAEEIVADLRTHRIEASPMWKPMHQQSLNQDLRYFGIKASNNIHRRFLSLPSGSSLTAEQLEQVCSIVRETLKGR